MSTFRSGHLELDYTHGGMPKPYKSVVGKQRFCKFEELGCTFRSGHLDLDFAYCGRSKSLHFCMASNDFEDSRAWAYFWIRSFRIRFRLLWEA